MSEQINKELKEGILQRMTSPWFFTFIPWWVLFNYDFLLFATGNGDIIREMASHYCTKELYSTLAHFTIFGCAKPHTTLLSLLWFRFLLPVVATVVSMMLLHFLIHSVEEIYYAIKKKNYLFTKQKGVYKRKINNIRKQCTDEIQKKNAECEQYKKEIEFLKKQNEPQESKSELVRQQQMIKNYLPAIQKMIKNYFNK